MKRDESREEIATLKAKLENDDTKIANKQSSLTEMIAKNTQFEL
jgi:hypothetical protein